MCGVGGEERGEERVCVVMLMALLSARNVCSTILLLTALLHTGIEANFVLFVNYYTQVPGTGTTLQ